MTDQMTDAQAISRLKLHASSLGEGVHDSLTRDAVDYIAARLRTLSEQPSAALSAEDLFDPARLPARDEEGRLTHPDLRLVVFVEDEIDVTPFFNDAGLDLRSVKYDWTFEEDNDGVDMNWLTPEAPTTAGGWRLVSIHDNEDGEGVVWWARYVGTDARKAAPPTLSEQQGEAVAYCEPDNPNAATAFSWVGTDRKARHSMPLFTRPSPLPCRTVRASTSV